MGITLFIVFIGIIVGLLFIFACADQNIKSRKEIEPPACMPEPPKEIVSPAVKAFKTFMMSKYHHERKAKSKEASA